MSERLQLPLSNLWEKTYFFLAPRFQVQVSIRMEIKTMMVSMHLKIGIQILGHLVQLKKDLPPNNNNSRLSTILWLHLETQDQDNMT